MNREPSEITRRAPSLDRNGRAAYRVAPTDWDLSTTVVEAVTEIVGEDVLAGDRVLYDVIDPDALNRVFEGRDGSGATDARIVFELRGCRVEVRADGDHVVHEPDAGEESSTSAAQSV